VDVLYLFKLKQGYPLVSKKTSEKRIYIPLIKMTFLKYSYKFK
jgi:hypothetical protein